MKPSSLIVGRGLAPAILQGTGFPLIQGEKSSPFTVGTDITVCKANDAVRLLRLNLRFIQKKDPSPYLPTASGTPEVSSDFLRNPHLLGLS
jgi:hypothetical protein